jgi:thioredoxin 1
VNNKKSVNFVAKISYENILYNNNIKHIIINKIEKDMIEITSENFNQVVLESPIPVLLDFTAPWCGPCQAIAPMLEDLSEEFEGKIVFAKVNVDNNGPIAIKYGVRNIPTIVLIKNGKQEEKLVGANTKEVYRTKLTTLLA